MTREYILMNENRDEKWFPKTKVAEELTKFVKSECNQEKHIKNAVIRSKLKKTLDKLNIGVNNKKFKSGFLNEVFQRFFEIKEGLY